MSSLFPRLSPVCLGLAMLTASPQPLALSQAPTAYQEVSQELGIFQLSFLEITSGNRFSLPPAPGHITSIRYPDLTPLKGATWIFNQDATKLELELPAEPRVKAPLTLEFETAESSRQFADGRIVFSAKDAKITGETARLESHPGNHRIGFWSKISDYVTWDYTPTRWGMYDVEISFSADGGVGTEIEVLVAGKRLTATRPSTGSWYRYQTLTMGRVYIEKSAPFQVQVKGLKQTGAAIMNLKAVTLRPAPEGGSIRQDATGELTLHSREAITRSVLMRYEPQTNKNCLGYWVNVKDQAQWRFQVDKEGLFDVEVWQGCGKGQGGSDVSVDVGSASLAFVVEDTGHFQNFKPRVIGKVKIAAGQQELWVRPRRKQAGAIMDIHKIRLIPADGK